MTYTLADLAEITDLKRRTLQLWADAGVIRAEEGTDRSGTGTHRQFNRYEVMLACLLAPLVDLQLPIGQFIKLSLQMRVADAPPLMFKHPLISDTTVRYEGMRLMKRKGGDLWSEFTGLPIPTLDHVFRAQMAAG